jgi:hypothetical protein
MEGLGRAHRPLNLPRDVEEARVHADLFVSPPIAQRPVQLLQGGAVILAMPAEGDRDLFLGVHVADADGARIAIGDSVLRGAHAKHQRKPAQHQRHGEAAAGPADA